MYQFLTILICLFQTGIILTEYDRNNGPVPDYGFIAYLFSTRNSSAKCTGAIVAKYWILNYCEYGLYEYDAVRVGVSKAVSRNRIQEFIYQLVERVTYPGHDIKQFPQINEIYDLESLYASQHSVFLDRTKDEMRLNLHDAVWPIKLSRGSELPDKAYAHFFPKADANSKDSNARHKELGIVNNDVCNNYFRKYNLALHSSIPQFCVDSSKVTFDDCCANHAIMESNMTLIGLMAWSTACWNPPEPWVFTNLGWYYDWITNITSWDPLFPPSLTRTAKKATHRKIISLHYN